MFTIRNEVAKVVFLHLSVILFTGGVCLSACWDTPREAPPPQEAPPHPSPGKHNPLRETAAAADDTHPTGMHSCFNDRFGRHEEFC